MYSEKKWTGILIMVYKENLFIFVEEKKRRSRERKKKLSTNKIKHSYKVYNFKGLIK
jgi:hypothetical protein